jgi:hypothetical protein
MRYVTALTVVLYLAGAGLSSETYDSGTKTLTVTADSLAAMVDPVGELQDWDATYQQPAMTKDAFNALSGLKTITFNSAVSQFNLTTTIKAYYDATHYVTFSNFGDPNGYNYGGGTSNGRRAHSGTSDIQQLGYVQGTDAGGPFLWLDPVGGVSNHNWLKMDISVSDPSRGVVALGFIVDGRDDQNTQDGKISLKLSDSTVVQLSYGTFGGGGVGTPADPKGLFFGYQAPAGKFITRIECTRSFKSGSSFGALDDLTFVIYDPSAVDPPAAITDLAASNPTEDAVALTWTAPGDSGTTGTAASYDIRYSTSAITNANFASASQFGSPPAPAAPGTVQTATVTGLNPYTVYYFAVKTTSQGGLTSGLSNVPSIRTAASTNDTTPPAAITDLTTSDASYTTMTLNWTAPADPNSPCAAYDIRYSTATITDANWGSATQVAGEPAPHEPGSSQYFVVGGLNPGTTYYFAIKTSDAPGNVSELSNVASGATLAAPPQASKLLLRQADFRYKGYYKVQRDGNYNNMAELEYGQGFTHRYVNGQLRFLVFSFFGNVPGGGYHLIEFAAPASLGGTITTRTNHWPDIWTGGLLCGNWIGLWYEQAQNRLWTASAIDYPDDTQAAWTKSLAVRTLNDDGTISNGAGPWGLTGVQQRRVYGGVVAIPQWFQDFYGVAPYAVGWGGYASRMSLGVSMGPTFYAIPEPTGYPAGDIPTGAFKTLMDHSGGTLGADWYASGHPTSFDRGVRNTDVKNDYDTPYWQSPAPDGLGRWTWGDSNWNTGTWIETPTRFGFITVPKLCNGRTWYETSTLHCERQSAEIQVFDPRELGEVALGTRPSWKTYPASRWEITGDCTPFGLMWGRSGNGPDGGPCGASYDSTTRTLYIYCVHGTSLNSYILIYDVGPIPGDVDGDGHVDASDLLAVAAAFGSVAGGGNYNAACDFNGDSVIDVSDLLILAQNWAT